MKFKQCESTIVGYFPFCQTKQPETSRIINIFMHQSIPAAPSPTPHPGYCGAFARLVSPGGGAFANFALPGGRAFANPGANPELLTRTRFPIRI